ncbi:MAG: DUF3987 domain-containing protein [Cyanobacteria bacterium P01_H01_bin.26]
MQSILTKSNKVSNSQIHFTVGVNTQVVGKCDANKLSYPSAWTQTSHTMASLAEHIGKGHPWMPGLLDGNCRRKKSNVVRADMLAIDVDDGVSIAQAKKHSFIKKCCGLAIESSNSRIVSEKNPDGHDKYRLVFLLAAPIEGWERIEICNQYLATLITVKGKPIADPACKDASRFYFGGKDRTPFILNEDARLPKSFVEDALAWHDLNQALDLLDSQANRQQWEETSHEDLINWVADALSHIAPYRPGENRYPELIAMIAGVLNDLGVEGEDLLQDWDAGQGEWGNGGFERILRSVRTSQTSRKATVGTLFYLAETEGWEFPKNATEQYRKHETPQDSMKSVLEQLLDEGVGDADINAQIPEIAKDYGVGSYDVRRLRQSIEQEQAKAESSEAIDLKALAKAAANDLDLYRVFPEPLAKAIESKCESDKVDPIRPVQAFLPAAASLLGSRTRVLLKEAVNPLDDWHEYAHISTIDIGLASSNKSQTMKTMLNPIKQKQKQLNRDAKEKHEMWLQLCKVSDGETPDEPPPARMLYVTGGTSEGIQQFIADQPPRSGMLMVLDELAKLLSADQYKTGAKGSFKEFLLSAMTSPLGSGEGDVRKSKETMAIFEEQLLCIAGGIQPKRLKTLFDPESDDAGLGSRFLCAYPKLPPDYAQWSDVQVDIFDTLSGLFDYLMEIGNPEDEPITCVLSKRAEQMFMKHYEAFRQIQVDSEHSNPGLYAFIGKCAGHLGRLTLLCHWIACYYKQEKPAKITLRSFNRGLYLLNYYIGQFRILQIQVSGGDENYGKLHLYILEQLKRKSEVTDQSIRKGFNRGKKQGSRTSEHEVRQAFKDLATNSVGVLVNDEKTLKKS